MNDELDISICNKNAELCLVGSLYKEPELYVTYGNVIRSKYDFSDSATIFFYNLFEQCYLTFTQDTNNKSKIDNFASQNAETFKKYKAYGGWKTISEMMNIADSSDFKNYFTLTKKFSLLREYHKQGFAVDKIMSYKKFGTMTAADVYRMIRSQCDKINTNISVVDNPIVITEKMPDLIESFLSTPQMGTPTCFKGYDDYFRGFLPETIMFSGMLSNEGKSRLLCLMLLYAVVCEGKKVMLLSNEMTEHALKCCLAATAINNEYFRALHGVHIKKCEREITLGQYHEDGEKDRDRYIERKIDYSTGEYIETEEEFKNRIKATKEYQGVQKVMNWLSSEMKGKLFFHDITSDYSWEAIEFEIRRAKLLYQCDIFALDTMKTLKEDWVEMKLLATNLVQLGKELGVYGYASFQLTDDSAFCDIYDLTSNNIAAAKGIKHPADVLLMGKRITREDYDKYQIIPFEDDDAWGEVVPQDLDPKKQYFCQKVDKNRLGEKPILVFEVDLNYNTWTNVGTLSKSDKYMGGNRGKK